MPDYDLSGLSPRSFEQLIQAIAIRVLGYRVQVFGDGPDGGREATFEGPVPYPIIGYQWDGYGVIQAKFHQRPNGRASDADWALRQLQEELKKYASAKDNRREPEYYIFATNVILTPVQERGSKDRAIRQLDDFKSQSSLKDYDI